MNEDIVKSLEEDYHRQLGSGDKKMYITLSKLKFEEGNTQLKLNNFHSATSLFDESVRASIENLKILNTFSPDNEGKNQFIFKSKGFAVEYMSFYFCSLILDLKMDISKPGVDQRLDKIIHKKKLLNFDGYRFGEQDIARAREMAIIRSFRHKIHSGEGVTEVIDFFAKNIFSNINAEALNSLRDIVFNEAVTCIKDRSKRLTSDDNKSIAEIYNELALYYKTINDTCRYSEAMTESLKYYCLTATNLKEHRRLIDDLQRFMGQSDYRLSQNDKNRKIHLEMIFALTRGLDLTSTLLDRIDISEEIISHYEGAHHYNSKRFKVYADWLNVANSIITVRKDKSISIDSLTEEIKSTQSLKYVDRDEQWLSDNMPEIVASRANIQIVAKYLEGLTKKQDTFTGSPELNSALYLYNVGWLNLSTSLMLIKKFVEKELKLVESPEPLNLTNESAIRKSDQIHIDRITGGENEKVELKKSWKYDENEKCPKVEIERAALRAIASFMNTEGGYLYVGVDDSHRIVGLEEMDFRGMNSKYKRISEKLDRMRIMIDEAIKKYLGKDNLSNIKVSNQMSDDNKNYLAINVAPSAAGVYLDGKFYIRGAASSNLIEGRELVSYCISRFR